MEPDEQALQRYLTAIGAQQVDQQFNQMLQQYNRQLQLYAQMQEQSTAAAYEGAVNRAVESTGQFGTGARAVQFGQFETNLQQQVDKQQQDILSQQQSFQESLIESYTDWLEGALGDYDPETGQYKNVDKFNEQANLLMDSALYELSLQMYADQQGMKIEDVWKQVDAGKLIPELDFQSGAFKSWLLEQGILTESQESPGDFALNQDKLEYLNWIMNTPDYDPDNTGPMMSRWDRLIEHMAEEAYGIDEWTDMDDSKQDSIRNKYRQWLSRNNFVVQQNYMGLIGLPAVGYMPGSIEYNLNQSGYNFDDSIPYNVLEQYADMLSVTDNLDGVYIYSDGVSYIVENGVITQTVPENIDRISVYSDIFINTRYMATDAHTMDLANDMRAGRMPNGTMFTASELVKYDRKGILSNISPRTLFVYVDRYLYYADKYYTPEELKANYKNIYQVRWEDGLA